MSIEKLDAKQLQAALKKITKPLQGEVAPYLYYLRVAMRTPGKAGGWGAWVRENLPFSLKTATNWANDYGVEHDLMKEQKRTSGKSARGKHPEVNPFAVPRPEWFTKTKEKELERAIFLIGDLKAFQICFDAVMKAAHGKALSANA